MHIYIFIYININTKVNKKINSWIITKRKECFVTGTQIARRSSQGEGLRLFMKRLAERFAAEKKFKVYAVAG